jgi:hypothetical protein
MELHELLVGRRQLRHCISLYAGEGRAHLCPGDDFPGLGTCRRRQGLGRGASLASALLRVRATGYIAPFHMPCRRAHSCFVM